MAVANIPHGAVFEKIVVNLQLGKTGIVEFFWNDFTDVPLQQRIAGSEKTQVSFPAPGRTLRVVRIDPGDSADNDIEIFSISLVSTDGTVTSIPLDAVAATWQFANLAPPQLVNGVLKTRSLTNDPYFFGPIQAVQQSWWDRTAWNAAAVLRSTSFVIQALVFGSLAALLIACGIGRSILVVLAIALAVGTFFGARDLFAGLLHDRYDVGTAVGYAAFLGKSIRPSSWAGLCAGVAALMFGFAFAQIRRARPAAAPSLPSPERWNGWQILAAAVWLACVALVMLPDFSWLATATGGGPQYVYNWDGNNLIAWLGFIARGDIPVRDFWWPYSGLWVQFIPGTTGPLVFYLYEVALFGVIGLAIIQILRPHTLTGLVTALLVLLLAKSNVIGFHERYLLSVALALGYCAIKRSSEHPWYSRILFWMACVVALWGEPLQFAYAAPAIGLTWLLSEIEHRPHRLVGVVGRALADFVVPLLAVAGYFAALIWRGELASFIENYRQLLAGSIYGAMPTPLSSIAADFPGVMALGVFAPIAIATAGAYLYFSQARSAQRWAAMAAMLCGLVGVMVMQKILFRAMEPTQLLAPTLTGVLFLVAGLPAGARKTVAVATFAGVVAAAIYLNPALWQTLNTSVGGIAHRVEASELLLADRPVSSDPRNGFRRQNFINFKDEVAVIDALRLDGDKRIFVMGDMPMFYLFSKPPAPYHINFYNASPLRAQLQIRDSLEKDPPEYVILDPRSQEFDGIQNVVRVPIITVEVVLNYVLSRTVGPYDILTRRPQGQPVPIDFWRGIYGDNVNFGHLLDMTQANGSPGCEAAAALVCSRYVQVKFADKVNAETVVRLPVRIGSTTFWIAFSRSPDQQTYLLPVERIWFWRAAEANGISPTVEIPPGIAAETAAVGKATGEVILY